MSHYRKSIIFKITIFFLLFGLTLLATMVTTFLVISKDDIEKETYEKLILSGEMIANKFEIYRTAVESRAIALASTGSLLTNEDVKNRLYVKSLLNQPSIAGGGIWPEPYSIDSKKEKNAIYFSRSNDTVLHYDDTYNDKDGLAYFKESSYNNLRFLPKDTPVWSHSYIDPLTKVHMSTVSVPMYKDSKFFGVSTIDIDMSYVEARLKEIAKKIGGYAFTLDRDNSVIAFTNEGDIPKSTTIDYLQSSPIKNALNSINNSLLAGNDTLVKTILRKSPNMSKSDAVHISEILNRKRHHDNNHIFHETFEIENDSFLNQNSFGLIYAIAANNWKLGFVIPFDVAFMQAHDILKQLILISLSVTLIITFLGYIIIKRVVVNPITHISNQLIADKNNNILELVPIVTDQHGEIGTMVSTLNNRTGALQENYKTVLNLQKEIEETQKEVVFTMGAIGESRSKETGNHVKRVAEYSKTLAKHYGLPDDECEMLKQASPMHDIGKVAIPDSILNKPGRFNDEERKIMDTHAKLGYEMLKHSERPLLKMAETVAYEHHEKWDGSGYPRGFKGEQIHIYGRITALADVFDALGSSRVYKAAWDDEKIFKLFKDERGKHFEPKLIDIFFEHIDEFLSIRDKFKDVS